MRFVLVAIRGALEVFAVDSEERPADGTAARLFVVDERTLSFDSNGDTRAVAGTYAGEAPTPAYVGETWRPPTNEEIDAFLAGAGRALAAFRERVYFRIVFRRALAEALCQFGQYDGMSAIDAHMWILSRTLTHGRAWVRDHIDESNRRHLR